MTYREIIERVNSEMPEGAILTEDLLLQEEPSFTLGIKMNRDEFMEWSKFNREVRQKRELFWSLVESEGMSKVVVTRGIKKNQWNKSMSNFEQREHNRRESIDSERRRSQSFTQKSSSTSRNNHQDNSAEIALNAATFTIMNSNF